MYLKGFYAEIFWIQVSSSSRCCHGYQEKPPAMSFPIPTLPLIEEFYECTGLETSLGQLADMLIAQRWLDHQVTPVIQIGQDSAGSLLRKLFDWFRVRRTPGWRR